MLRRSLYALLAAVGTFAAGTAQAQSCDTSFQLENRSGATINEFYFNPARNPNWGNDRLGDGVLAAGRSRSWAPGRGGSYDFRVVWDSGKAAEIRNVDICSASSIVAVGGRLIAE